MAVPDHDKSVIPIAVYVDPELFREINSSIGDDIEKCMRSPFTPLSARREYDLRLAPTEYDSRLARDGNTADMRLFHQPASAMLSINDGLTPIVHRLSPLSNIIVRAAAHHISSYVLLSRRIMLDTIRAQRSDRTLPCSPPTISLPFFICLFCIKRPV